MSYAFTKNEGGTSSHATGPSAGVGGSGSYLYAETSGGSTGKLFTLSYDGSACSDIGLGVSTVVFHYHMYGDTIGELRVTNAAGEAVWSLTGDQGDSWQAATVDVYSPSFAFEYTRGSSYTGDAAVALVAVSCGAAPPRPPPSPPSQPPSTISSAITCSSGSWQAEVGWSLTCSDDTTLSGGAPYTSSVPLAVALGATCTLSMTDSYGDGWNGAEWAAPSFGQSFSLADGYQGTRSFLVQPPSPPGTFTSTAYLKTAVQAFNANPTAAIATHGLIADWDVSAITDTSLLFYNLKNFNDDISSWDTSGVTDMSQMFFVRSSCSPSTVEPSPTRCVHRDRPSPPATPDRTSPRTECPPFDSRQSTSAYRSTSR